MNTSEHNHGGSGIIPDDAARWGAVARREGRADGIFDGSVKTTGVPVAMAIPCQHVVRTAGSLSGDRRGIDRKARLLKREREKA